MKKAPGQGFHDVFTQPESVEAYKKTGKFPDGTVLVKEIRKINAGKMTTGQAYWAGDIASWFVMIKDAQGRFKNNPNWGEGWGWALFEAKDPNKNVSANFQKDCIPCHVPAKNTGWVYIQGYPTLK
jgi:cytochrome c